MEFEDLEELFDAIEMVEWNNSFGEYTQEQYEELMNELHLMIEDFQDLE